MHRINAAGWPQRMTGQTLFVPYRFRGRRLWRLARKPDGSCVFLADDQRCRLHAETGAASKPLACRLYPFVPVPGADGPRLDLRMDCPSIAGNEGRTLSVHAGEIAGLAEETAVTAGMGRLPAWGGGRPLTPREYTALAEAFDSILARTGEPLRLRLRVGCELLNLIYAARVDKVRDDRFVELIALLANAAWEEAAANIDGENEPPDSQAGQLGSETSEPPGSPRRNVESEPTHIAYMDSAGMNPAARSDRSGAWTSTLPLDAKAMRLFRQWLFLHTIADDPAALLTGRIARLASSWRRYGYARRFARGTGQVPHIRPDWPDTTFEAVDAVGPADEADLEPLERSMRLKLDSHAFAGPAYFDYDAIAGMTALWLMPALVGWVARLHAVGRRGDRLTADDLDTGIRQVHETFGVSPVFTRISERLRLRALGQPNVPAAILAAYAP